MLPTPPPSPHLKGINAAESRVGSIIGDGIRLTEVLGVGAYGVVYKARDTRTGLSCAVKALNTVGLSKRQETFLAREIELHQRASSHPNVVTLLGVLDAPDCKYVVLEYCDEGDLFGNITERGHFIGNDVLAKSIFLQILDAVDFCHTQGIYHRDLKPENILITNGGTTAKLADFGLACTDACSSDFGCGSTFYMSPECLQSSPTPFACYASAPNDVWSLGIILSNLITGRNPWKKASLEDPTFAAFLRDSEFLKSILPITDEMDWIMRRIFECDPAQRVTIPQLRQMIIECQAFTTTNSCIKSQYISLSPNDYVYNNNYLTVHTPAYSTYSGSSGSDEDWASAPHSPYAMPVDTSMGWQPELSCDLVAQPLPPPVDEVSSISSSWYSTFVPALDLAQKHLSIHPFFPGMGMTF